jgi:hypothetical protein
MRQKSKSTPASGGTESSLATNTFTGLEEKFSTISNVRQRIRVRHARRPVPDPVLAL